MGMMPHPRRTSHGLVKVARFQTDPLPARHLLSCVI
jgi:hypothetical protein